MSFIQEKVPLPVILITAKIDFLLFLLIAEDVGAVVKHIAFTRWKKAGFAVFNFVVVAQFVHADF